MSTINEYQSLREKANAVEVDSIPECAPYARKHIEGLTERGQAALVQRQLVREAKSSRRTRDFESLEKHSENLQEARFREGLAAFVQALKTGREAYGRREPIRHYGQAKNPVNGLPVERQAVLAWEAVCSMLGRMATPDRPLDVQTLAGKLARRLKGACNLPEYGVLGYERAALVLLDHFANATGWIEEVPGERLIGRVQQSPNTYRLTEKFLSDVLGGGLAADFAERRPMLVPPVPWTETATHGGYLHNGVQAVRGVSEAIGSPEIVAALNALQATPFRVNRRLLDVARSFRTNAEDFGGVVIAGQYIETRHDREANESRSKMIRSALTLAAGE
ncbi:hypothetical protein [Burkholderia sp. 22PA0106]|uniref:hypothetical protein n=1 Tax=Burkholderia sp. 22PA0106 TaxID=3237371 RepID=UPI0039C39B55